MNDNQKALKKLPECDGCGNPDPQRLKECPHCGSMKCNACDMGDDVECASCTAEDF